MNDELVNTKYQHLLTLLGEKANKKGKSLQFYYKYAKNHKNEKQVYILDILLSFPFENNRINIKNKNYLIFFSKFLDISKRILEDDYKEDEPIIIINSEDLKKLGKDKELILQYIKLSSLYEEESLKLFFYFLYQNITLLNLSFFQFTKKNDLIDNNKLKIVYDLTKPYKKNEKK